MNISRLERISGALAFWLCWPISFVRLQRVDRTRVLVVTADGFVLLLREWYAPARWSLPGGGVQRHESYVQSASRELNEEASLALGEEQFIAVGKGLVADRGLHFRCHFFIVHLSKKFHIMHQPPEVLEAAWLPLHEVVAGKHPIGNDVRIALSYLGNLVK